MTFVVFLFAMREAQRIVVQKILYKCIACFLHLTAAGLAVDHKQRRLYFTNMGQVLTGGISFSWHKVEMINLDGTQRRTIYNLAEKPRALNLDLHRGYVKQDSP